MDRFLIIEDFAASRSDTAANGHKRRAFARAVGADQTDDFPFVHS